MKFKLFLLALVASIFTLSPSTSFASISTSQPLRSAYLQRAQGEMQPLNRRDADSIRTDLQSHFDAVLEFLDRSNALSLQVSLARLERQQGVKWSDSQRSYWKKFLSENRAKNIERLTAYRHRGLFPQNDGYSQKAVPIFVDRHDTACAVGHLMRESGWDREVDMIEAINLLVYVTDVKDGPIVHWVLQSGLTQEEAALIQPGYPIPTDHTISEFTPAGASLSSGDLTYSQFSTTAAGTMGIRAGEGYYESGYGLELGDIDPVGTDWLVVGNADFFQQAGSVNNTANEDMTLQFRVQTGPGESINQMSIQTDYWEGGFNYSTTGQKPVFGNRLSDLSASLYAEIKDYFGMTGKITNLSTSQQYPFIFNADTIDESYNDENPNKGNGVLTTNFPSGNDFLVEINSYYYQYDDIRQTIYLGLGSYVVDFNVVPEPTSLSAVSLAVVCIVGKRRGRTTP